MRHHQEADGLQAPVAGQPEVLDGDVRLGAVGGDPAHRGAVVGGGPDVVDDADAGQHQEGDPGAVCAVRTAALISSCSGVRLKP